MDNPIPIPYILFAVILATLIGLSFQIERHRKRLHRQHQEMMARIEGAQQRAEGAQALRQEMVELAQESVRKQEMIIELLRQLVEHRT